ncbi:hypothetical protein GOP47_0027858, partial [Adiantum capillus-veneris]
MRGVLLPLCHETGRSCHGNFSVSKMCVTLICVVCKRVRLDSDCAATELHTFSAANSRTPCQRSRSQWATAGHGIDCQRMEATALVSSGPPPPPPPRPLRFQPPRRKEEREPTFTTINFSQN